ncbi:MAG: CoA ester lyase [Acholeplasmataceae bacterium]
MTRSLLFIPANTPAMIQNADIFEADAIIFDLEDAIHPLEKDAARILLKEYFKTNPHLNIDVIIRINDVSSPYFLSDIKHIMKWPVQGIMLPKASIASVEELDQLLSKYEKRKKNHEPLWIIPIIEQARSLFEVHTIASHVRVKALLLGGEDLATDLEVERTQDGEEILLARQLVIYAAKAYGKEAIDTPFTHVDNAEGLISDAKHAKRLGMTGKACIHPIQIDTINELFSPTQEQIDYAKKIVLAEEQASGKGAFSVDGKMIDKPIIMRAKKLLEKVTK